MLLLEVIPLLTNRCGCPQQPALDMLSCCLSQVCNCDLGALIYPKAAADKLQPGQQLSIIAQMIRGLAHLHAHGVQHLDM
jgi:serine/threonine protein kinase